VNALNDQQVALILTGQALSPAAQESLQAIRDKKTEMTALQLAQTARNTEMESITKDQARVRENLKAMQAAGGDKSLVSRYTKQLAAQEDRLEALRHETEESNAQLKARQAELESLIQALSVDVTMSSTN
jgi:hypothetical protein